MITNQRINVGIYFSNHIEVCEKYADAKGFVRLGNHSYLIAFQCRVRPNAIR